MTSKFDELDRLCALVADPVDHQALCAGAPELVAALADLQARRALRQVDGSLVGEAFDALLLRADGTRAYPVRDGVADLLPSSGILLEPSEGAQVAPPRLS